jgi:23S rRNA pseudouridine2457 synthase
MLLAFNKPYGVLSQFTSDAPSKRTLAEFRFPKQVYSLGRLDADSEGLLLLTDEATLNHKLLHPERAHEREYWVQVERRPSIEALYLLEAGVLIDGRKTLPARAWIIESEPELPPRDPPIRFRKTVPTCWIGIALIEGKNRQVRRMTAAIGHPTLRLIRVRIGRFELRQLPVGSWCELDPQQRKLVFGLK